MPQLVVLGPVMFTVTLHCDVEDDSEQNHLNKQYSGLQLSKSIWGRVELEVKIG